MKDKDMAYISPSALESLLLVLELRNYDLTVLDMTKGNKNLKSPFRMQKI
jgi:hypothetical protein